MHEQHNYLLALWLTNSRNRARRWWLLSWLFLLNPSHPNMIQSQTNSAGLNRAESKATGLKMQSNVCVTSIWTLLSLRRIFKMGRAPTSLLLFWIPSLRLRISPAKSLSKLRFHTANKLSPNLCGRHRINSNFGDLALVRRRREGMKQPIRSSERDGVNIWLPFVLFWL
jgi:hypothetical protein